MKANRLSRPLVAILLALTALVAAYLLRSFWIRQATPINTGLPTANEIGLSDKIIVSDQAQKNLGLTASPLRADVFWKTLTVPGMIVDRPGMSDREVVAPTVGIVSNLFHVPGDTVKPGEVLMTLKLASESLHQTQANLFKTSQDIELAQSRLERLSAGGEAIPRSRLIEVEDEIKRLEAAVKALREELKLRAFSPEKIAGVERGELVSELSIVAPPTSAGYPQFHSATPAVNSDSQLSEQPPAYELQELKVELGEQVQAGQTLCHLSSHKFLAIEGRAFRDETNLLERSVQNNWPVDVDFQESATGDWSPNNQTFFIRYLANTIDPVSRTFAFLLPLENQYKTVNHGEGTQILWRFRPGQKVLLHVRTEKLDDVFVLPADAVVVEGADAYVFTQNVNTFERKSVHVLFRDRDEVVLANDGALPTYVRNGERVTIAAVVRKAAAQLNRMAKAGFSGVPKGYHIHADGSLHKNEDEGK